MGEARRRLHKFAASLTVHSVGIALLGHRTDGSKGLVDQGTGTLVDTGERRILLTADHVAAAWLDRTDRLPGVVGADTGDNNVFVNEWTVIDRDAQYDVATIELPDAFDPASLGKRIHVMQWPPLPLSIGTPVAFVGVPGSERVGKALGWRHITTDITGRSHWGPRVRMDAKGDARHSVQFGSRRTPGGSSGGISGAGVFSRGYGDTFALRAVVCECGTNAEGSGVVVEDDARYASFVAADLSTILRRDGTLIRP